MPFCRYCGNKIEEGEVCSCEKAQAAAGITKVPDAPVPEVSTSSQSVDSQPQQPVMQPQGQPQYNQAQYQQGQKQADSITIPVDVNAAKDAAKGAYGDFMNMIKAPVTGSAMYISGNNRGSSIVLMLVQAVFSSIFAIMLVGSINSLIGAAGMLGGGLDEYKFSNVTAFFVTLLFSVITAAIFMGVFWCALQISKCKASFAEIIDLAGVRASFSIPLILLSMVLKLLNPIAGIGCFYISAILAGIVICTALVEKYPEHKNTLIYILLVAIVVFILVSAFVYSKAAVLYVPKSIRDQISDIGSLMSMFG